MYSSLIAGLGNHVLLISDFPCDRGLGNHVLLISAFSCDRGLGNHVLLVSALPSLFIVMCDIVMTIGVTAGWVRWRTMYF